MIAGLKKNVILNLGCVNYIMSTNNIELLRFNIYLTIVSSQSREMRSMYLWTIALDR